MVSANYCYDTTIATVVLRRRQWLRHLGYVDYQTPGEDIAANLANFSGLTIFNGDGTDPVEASRLIQEAVGHVRGKQAPALLRLSVPRLEGHSYQDTQTYKSEAEIEAEWARDPLPKLKAYCAKRQIGDEVWADLERETAWQVEAARAEAEARGVSSPETVTTKVFFDGDYQQVGGRAGLSLDGTTDQPQPEGQRINMVTAIRRVLDQELEANPRVLVFGEDVGPKGGVHAVTLGLQDKFGRERVFDTSLNEEGIVGRAVGMALAGLMPVPEIQFRKYAEPATEQIHDCGTMRWRTNNRFAAPMVLRVPGGFFKCGDPWHSMTNEVEFVHNPGWKVAVPSNAEDAVGLLRGFLARQRSCAVLRTSRDARRQLGSAAVAGRRVCAAVRPGEENARRRPDYDRHLGRDGAAMRSCGRRI